MNDINEDLNMYTDKKFKVIHLLLQLQNLIFKLSQLRSYEVYECNDL